MLVQTDTGEAVLQVMETDKWLKGKEREQCSSRGCRGKETMPQRKSSQQG